RMYGTQFAGEFQPAGEPIDGDDRIAACDPRRHQPGEADPTDPVNRDRLTGGGLHHIQHRPGTGLQTTAEGAQRFNWCVAADLDDVFGRGEGEIRERGLLKEAGIDRLAVADYRDRAIGAATARFKWASPVTIGDAPSAAQPAFAAPWKRDHN